jgi:uncharacterized membrane protein YgdD (TMEM256/DUF423 family)
MRSPLRIAHNVRLASILAVGAFALHQLRYLIASGASSAEHSAHGYMTDLMAPIAVLVLAGVLATLIRGTEDAAPARAPLGRRIALFAGALFAIHLGQESLEALITGHAALVDAVLRGGGPALPLALVIGALSALLASALERVERAIAIVRAERVRTRAPVVHGRALSVRGISLPSSPLAFGLARRPPPPAPA